MWVRIGRVLGWNEAVDGIPVPVRHVSSGILSPQPSCPTQQLPSIP